MSPAQARSESSLRILVGIPTYDGQSYCRTAFIKFLASLTFPDLEFLFVTNSGDTDVQALESALRPLTAAGRTVRVLATSDAGAPIDRIIRNRNLLREEFLKGSWSHLLFLDSDLLGPKNLVEPLVNDAKELVTGVYLAYFSTRAKKPRVAPVLFVRHDVGESRQLRVEEVLAPRLFEATYGGLGCCLIARKALEKVRFRRLETAPDPDRLGEDTAFFTDCREAGFPLWCDSRVSCVHLKYPLDDLRNLPLDLRRYSYDAKNGALYFSRR